MSYSFEYGDCVRLLTRNEYRVSAQTRTHNCVAMLTHGELCVTVFDIVSFKYTIKISWTLKYFASFSQRNSY
jgi:hypothetical protein